MTVGTKIRPEWMLQKVTLWMLDSPEVRAQLSPLGRMLQLMETSVFFSVQWGEAGRLKQCQAAADSFAHTLSCSRAILSVCFRDLLLIWELLLPRNPFPRVTAAVVKSKQGNLQPRGRHPPPVLFGATLLSSSVLSTVSWFSTVPCR